MKLIYVLFDSLVRNALGAYGGRWIPTPNFDRFAARAVTFDNHWVGSLPCMPARREMHTGRYNFLHRGWGPLEPFDRSVFERLGREGVYTHLVSDHFHYFEDGGATYHQRYASWDFIRGQENDKWKAMVEPPIERFKKMYDPRNYTLPEDRKRMMHCITREFVKDEADFPCVKCFRGGLEFLDQNRTANDWLLQIECFDPHEPFYAPERFRTAAGVDESHPVLDWPRYDAVVEDVYACEQMRANFAGLVRMCDHYFGELLDYMDRHAMWEDTALVLTTDHGFLLSEHDWWGKCRMPFYNEVAHIPLMVYTPGAAAQAGRRCTSLTQTIDLAPTLLDYFGRGPDAEITGASLLPLLAHDEALRDVALYGIFGGSLNVTDGRYTYFHYPRDLSGDGLYEYTLMPTHMNRMFPVEQLRGLALGRAFDFTQGVRPLRIPALREGERPELNGGFLDTRSMLFDLRDDYAQNRPIDAPEVVARLKAAATAVLARHDVPAEVYERYVLEPLAD
ncbi:MAG: sulfatase [Burkholderiales bacterium]|nr:sulfatase [Burkholderiales bacterium]